MTDLHYLSATEAIAAFRARELSPVELLEAVIARAEDGVVVRPADADIIPPLSDYIAFWRAKSDMGTGRIWGGVAGTRRILMLLVLAEPVKSKSPKSSVGIR